MLIGGGGVPSTTDSFTLKDDSTFYKKQFHLSNALKFMKSHIWRARTFIQYAPKATAKFRKIKCNGYKIDSSKKHTYYENGSKWKIINSTFDIIISTLATEITRE